MSIRNRFLISLLGNILGGSFSFGTSLIIARALGPSEFGTYSFLQGCFLSLFTFTSLGSSTAFFTFLSQEKRGKDFYLFYALWNLLQWVGVVGLLFFLPHSIKGLLHLDHAYPLLFYSASALFFSQVWLAFAQIGDSHRDTSGVQIFTVAGVGTIFFSALYGAYWLKVGLDYYFISTSLIYFLVSIAYGFKLFRGGQFGLKKKESLRNVLNQYISYCRPLILYNLVSIIHTYIDIYLLQTFGGSTQQGYYSVSFRIAAISTLITRSITQIFWKEIADAYHEGNQPKVCDLYARISFFLTLVTTAICCFFIPFSRELLIYSVGSEYASHWQPLAIMLLFPITTALGNIHLSMFYAMNQTAKNTRLGLWFMGVSIFTCYFVLASPQLALPGLGLGAMGLAIKMVGCGLFHVAVMAYTITRFLHLKIKWVLYAVNLPVFALLAFGSKMVVGLLFSNLGSTPGPIPWLINMGLSGVLYLILGALWSLWVCRLNGIVLKTGFARKFRWAL